MVQDHGGVPRELDRGGGAAMLVMLSACESDEEERGGKFLLDIGSVEVEEGEGVGKECEIRERGFESF